MTSNASTPPAIETANIGRTFGKTVAVDNLSLRVETGQVFGLLGHNGAGKTTTIRLLTGVLALTSGGARVLGLDPEIDGSAIRARTGVLTETPALDERLTARENLTLFADMFGVPRPDVRSRVDDLLGLFGLAERGDDRVDGYSRGMKQRLAFARCLLHRPELLFLDEPTSGLDPVAARQVHDLIEQFRGEGRTIVICTHNLPEAQWLCDRVAVLERGRLIALGSPAQLIARISGGGVEIEVGDGSAATAIPAIEQILPNVTVTAHDGMLTVDGAGREQIPALVAALVSAEVAIYRVSPREASLEDVYFSLHERNRNT
jgi:ABC-2 type transport system ATP-binding protein